MTTSTTYRMPAEWEPHDAVWLQWPDQSMAQAHQMKLEGTWLAMASAMSTTERTSSCVSSRVIAVA